MQVYLSTVSQNKSDQALFVHKWTKEEQMWYPILDKL